MFKKIFPLIFLATVFLSVDNQTRAMQESDLESTSEKTTLQRDIFNCKQEICCMLSEILKDSQQICPSLKFLAASEYLKTLKSPVQELDTLGAKIPQELIEYCKQCYLIPFINLIHKHLASLERFKRRRTRKITKQNFNSYNMLLHQLLLSPYINIRDINIEMILQSFWPAFERCPRNITVENINVMLKLLMQPLKEYPAFSEEEIFCLNNIWKLIRKSEATDLLKLIAKNIKFLPQLNQILGTRTDETFFKFLIRLNDIDLFKSIINEEKNTNWEELFSNGRGFDFLDYALEVKPKMLEVLLELIKEKGLRLDDFINIQDNNYGKTLLMIAAIDSNDKIIKLLIDHGADTTILDPLGNMALDYAIENRARWPNPARDIKLKLDRCIELLTPTAIDFMYLYNAITKLK